MLPVRSGSPDGTGDGEGRSATTWTGEKKRRIIRPSPLGDNSGSTSSGAQQAEASSPDGAADMDIQPQDQRKGGGGQQQEEAPMICSEFVYSAQDEIGCDEFIRCHRKLEAYEFSLFVNTKDRIWDEAVLSELYKRLSLFRIKAYKILTGDPILDDCDTALGKDYPPDVFDWECDDFANHSSGGIFDWVFDDTNRADLDDYQRIIPKRNDFVEYLEWDQYRLTFSSYKTDMDYIQYCVEISKKIKWIEDFLDLPLRELEKMLYRAKRQAVKIAAEFPHMTATLAYRGFQEEYIWSPRFDISFRKDYDRIYFEVWKRVAKQEMSFRDALEEVLSKNMFPSRAKRMQAEIVRDGRWGMEREFNICMAHIPEEVVEDEKVEKLITDAVYNKFGKPKTYLQYVSKKLEAARCIGLIPSA